MLGILSRLIAHKCDWLAQKEIEPFCYDTNQGKHDKPERNHHVYICYHWNLPNARHF